MPARTKRTAIPFALVAAVALAGCAKSPSFFLPAGPVAASERDLFWFVIALLLVVVVPVFVGLPYVLWRFRQGNADSDYQPKWDFNTPLEYAIWGVPILVVCVLGVRLWHDTHKLDPYKRLPGENAIEIQAVALQWKWLFIYPGQQVATVNRLVIPAGRPVHIDLTSDSVMQSLLIPRLSGQIYAMAGMRTQLNLQADRPGSYFGENTQYNGDHFSQQNFQTVALDPQHFSAWLDQARSGHPPLDGRTYDRLSQPSTVKAPMIFSSIAPNLFARIIAKYDASGAKVAERGKASAK